VLVPSEAVIRTGERSLVILAEGEGRFRQQEVEIGIEMGGSTEIRKGLKAGDKIVLSGQFLIDSEASLRSTMGRLAAPKPAASPATALHKGTGVVTGVSAPDGYLELKHDPIPSMKWPVMQMGFQVVDRKLLEGLKKGDLVEFEMRGVPNKDGDFIVETVKRRDAKAAP
jgi:Cu(I)/Ag(I) efflux system membrane fusion protein